MTAEQFAYWMQGFAELNPSLEQPTAEQWQSMKDHLAAVFVKITPAVKVPASDRTHVPNPAPDFGKINWPLDQMVITC